MHTILAEDLEKMKGFIELMADLIPGGATFTLTNQTEIVWKCASKIFDIPKLQVGVKIIPGSVIEKSIQTGLPQQGKISAEILGARVKVYVIPVIENGVVIGTFNIGLPMVHPVEAAFQYFAPMIANMFPEGSYLCITDRRKYLNCQDSEKWTIPDVYPGLSLDEASPATQSIIKKVFQSNQPSSMEFESTITGMPIMIMSYPLKDENNAAAVGTFNITIPKNNAGKLRQLSGASTQALEEISSVAEEISASAVEINDNQGKLNSRINNITNIINEMISTLEFIKTVADETKMLGLNAAIEAARAGEIGRGFSVVAEEIRRLSDDSKKTVMKIRHLIDSINAEVQETKATSQMTVNSTQEQAAASQELTASIEEINSMVEELNNMAKTV
ncbi:MAG: methyl-accepting chemotaxis protein [Firmicutes bacterium]|nr:methyl-accepting chemotaxis protein [Bacillota bacterium]